MGTNELRINNYVLFSEDSTVFIVNEVNESGLSVANEDEVTWIEIQEFEPIPLTEEWMVKFGMELYDGFSSTRVLRLNRNPLDTSILTYNVVEGLLRFSNGHNKGSDLIPYVKYVHQFQNLYFAITGKDLLIKN
jgi:hypothetical protein